MSYGLAILLGIVQGLTEFLPVSSSGHLALGHAIAQGMGHSATGDNLLFDVILHIGTLVALFVFYRRDLLDMARETWTGLKAVPSQGLAGALAERPMLKLGLMIVVATLPTMAIGLGFKKPLEAAFHDIALIGAMLLLTAALVAGSSFVENRRRQGGDEGRTMDWGMALLIGVVQGLAITPGISRSGSTISVALLCGVARQDAARFSFLMSIPAVAGAVLLKGRDALRDPSAMAGMDALSIMLGLTFSALVGYLCLWLLKAVVRKGLWGVFAPYVAVVGLTALAFGLGLFGPSPDPGQ